MTTHFSGSSARRRHRCLRHGSAVRLSNERGLGRAEQAFIDRRRTMTIPACKAALAISVIVLLMASLGMIPAVRDGIGAIASEDSVAEAARRTGPLASCAAVLARGASSFDLD